MLLARCSGGLVDVGPPPEQLFDHRRLSEPGGRVQRCVAPAAHAVHGGAALEKQPRDARRGRLVRSGKKAGCVMSEGPGHGPKVPCARKGSHWHS